MQAEFTLQPQGVPSEFADHGWFGDAKRCLQAALRLDPQRSTAATALARTYAATGELGGAADSASRGHGESAALLAAMGEGACATCWVCKRGMTPDRLLAMDESRRPAAGPYRLRDYEAADFRELWRIDQQCFRAGIAYSQRELAAYMAMRGAFTIVAETTASGGSDQPGDKESEEKEEKKIAGFVVAQKHPRGLGHIVTIDVLPEVQRAGLGSLLMDAAEDRLRGLGCTAVYLETAVDNQVALRFYKRRAYTVLKTIPRYYLGTIDALLLGRRLDKK